jgi:hypothetical protein
MCCMGDYAIAVGALQWWQDDITFPLAQLVWDSMRPPFIMTGWGPDEYGTVTRVSQAGGAVVASNWASDLDVFTNFDIPAFFQKAAPPPSPPPTAVHTACLLMSDGDNVQWLLDGFATEAQWFGRCVIGGATCTSISSAMVPLNMRAAPLIYHSVCSNTAAQTVERCRLVGHFHRPWLTWFQQKWPTFTTPLQTRLLDAITSSQVRILSPFLSLLQRRPASVISNHFVIPLLCRRFWGRLRLPRRGAP